MGKETGIAWTDHTANPWIGCTEVSPGCDNCYARVMDARYKYGGATHWGHGVPRYQPAAFRRTVKALDTAAFKAGVHRSVFPSLCDPFDNEVPEEWRFDLFDLIKATPNLTWLLLTKRIGNAAKMIDNSMDTDEPAWPWPNVWLGASVVNQEEADRDIPKLLATPAAKRFVSYEPALGPIDFAAWLICQSCGYTARDDQIHGDHRLCKSPTARIDQIIVGGESNQGGAKARPFDLAWARSTVQQCRAAGIACFVKQLGSTIRVRNDSGNEWPSEDRFDDAIPHDYDPAYQGETVCIRLKDRAGAEPSEWPADLQVQEIPA